MNLNPIATTVTRPAGGKVSDGKSMVVHVPASSTIKAGDLVCLQATANAGAYFVGVAMADITTGSGETGSLVIDIAAGEVATQKLTAEETYTKGLPVWFDVSTGKITVSRSTAFVGFVSRAASSDATPTVYVLVAPFAEPDEVSGGLAAIADAANVAGSDVVDVAGADAAALVTDINKAGGVVKTVNAIRASINGASGLVVKINAIIKALEDAGIIVAGS